MPAGFLFNGALSTYEKLGFTRDRKIGKRFDESAPRLSRSQSVIDSRIAGARRPAVISSTQFGA